MGRYSRSSSSSSSSGGYRPVFFKSRDPVYSSNPVNGDYKVESENKKENKKENWCPLKERILSFPETDRYKCETALRYYELALEGREYDLAATAKKALTPCRKEYIKSMYKIERATIKLDPRLVRQPENWDDFTDALILHIRCKNLTDFYVKAVFGTYENEICTSPEFVTYAKRWVAACPGRYRKYMKEVDNFNSKFSQFSGVEFQEGSY